tara:strand:+ start:2507 stop:4393 length:1887 start_codon:yes stop_codon:yes gene_type:complete
MADLDALTVEELEALQSGGLDALSVDALQRLQGTAMPPTESGMSTESVTRFKGMQTPSKFPLPPIEGGAFQYPEASATSVEPPTGLEKVGNLAMEGVASVNRAGLGTADLVTSPVQALSQVLGFEMPSFSSLGTPKGGFAGEGLATDVMAAGGQLAVAGVMAGATTRYIASTLDDLVMNMPVSERGATLVNVVSQMGKTTPQQDLALSALAGSGGAVTGEVGAAIGGEEFRQPAELLGQITTPAVVPSLWRATTQGLLSIGRDFVAEAAPSVTNLKNTSRLLFSKLDEAGVLTNGPSTTAIIKRLEGFIDERNISSATGTSPIEIVLRGIIKKAEGGGVTYGFLNESQTNLQSIAGAAVDTPATRAREAYKILGSFLDDASPLMPVGSEGLNASEVLRGARSLWRRASVADNMDNIVNDTTVRTTAARTDFIPAFRKDLAKLLKSNSKEGQFLTETERTQLTSIVSGGRLEKMFEAAGAIGFSSGDLAKSIMVSGAVGVFQAGPTVGVGVGTGVGAAILTANAIGAAAKSRAGTIFKANAKRMQAYIRAGSNAEDITRLYTRSTPRAERNAADLTALFLENKVDFFTLRASGLGKMPLVADSVALGIASQNVINQAEEAQQQQQPPQQ